MIKLKYFYILLLLATLSFALQIGYYWAYTKLWHPDVFSSITSEDAYDNAIKKIESLRMPLWQAESKDEPTEELQHLFSQAVERNQIIEHLGRVQTWLAFPYLHIIVFALFPIIWVLGVSGFQGILVVFFQWSGLMQSHFHKDPTFITYFRVACVSFVAYIAIGFVIYKLRRLSIFKGW